MAKAPAFQHRHYAPLAARIRAEIANSCDPAGVDALSALAVKLGHDFEADNPNFDMARWRDAWQGSPSRKDERTAARLVRA